MIIFWNTEQQKATNNGKKIARQQSRQIWEMIQLPREINALKSVNESTRDAFQPK